jgi:hypothetical protein
LDPEKMLLLGKFEEKFIWTQYSKGEGDSKLPSFGECSKTDWLLWVLWEMTCPTKGRHSSEMLSEVSDSIWDEGSSHDRASI